MRPAWLVLLMTFALVLPGGLVMAQDGSSSPDDENETDEDRRGPPDHARGPRDNRSDDASDDDEDDDGPSERGQEMRSRGQGGPMAGAFDNGTFDGRWVSFTTDTGLPGIQDFTIKAHNATLLSEVILPHGEEEEGEERARGGSYRMETDDGRIQVLDNPVALLHVRGDDDANATIVLAPGVTVEALNVTDDEDDEEDEDSNRTLFLLTYGDNRTATLAGEGLTHDGTGTFTVSDKAQLRLGASLARDHDRDDDEDDDGDEDGPPGRGHGKAMALRGEARERMHQALANGSIAVEVFSDDGTGEPVAFELGHVKVRNTRGPQGHVRAAVDVEAPDDGPGAIIVLNLDEAALGNLSVAEAADQLAVRFDGEDIPPADDLADILRWNDDDAPAEFLLLIGAEGVQAVVSISHFSPHTVEVYQTQSSDEEPAAQTPLSALAALIAVGVAAVFVARRER